MIRSFQWDLARQVERLDWLLAQLPKYAEWGYQELHLHLEDAVEYPSLPNVARWDAYTYKQFGTLVAAADRVGIKVVPIVNLLGHTQYLIKVPELRQLNELRAADHSPLETGQICPVHPKTMEVAAKLLRDVAPFCTAGKVHVGLDESFHLGKHPLSRKDVDEIGLAGHFARYVQRLNGLVQSFGLTMSLWGDMLYFIPEAIPLLPTGITVYEWYYYAFDRRPKVELFNFAEMDIATPLLRRGIQLYGCPMNGAFRYEPLPHFHDRLENIISWWKYAHRIHATGFLVSSWEPYRLSVELTTAVDAAAATLWLNPGVRDPAKMLAKGFERVFGKRGKAAAKIALACDKYPFGGYPRWEINERWDTLSRRDDLKPYMREAAFLQKLSAAAKRQKAPLPFRASLAFRHALAERDIGLRRLARDASKLSVSTSAKPRGKSSAARNSCTALVTQLARTLRSGKRAAQTIWRRTRDPRKTSPNEQILQRDELKLRAFVRGEPVFGPSWQLCYQVWNFAPALQLVGVEQQGSDGTWQTLQSCHTIEFQARAARQRSDFVREHAAPVEWNGDMAQPPRLRIFTRGVGEVKVGRIVLTARSQKITLRSKQSWSVIGTKAPRAGLPPMDWNTNQGQLDLHSLFTSVLSRAIRSSSTHPTRPDRK